MDESYKCLFFVLHLLCTGDPLQQGNGGQIVISRGSPLAKLCVIGEAPGLREDELGKPFVGRSDLNFVFLLHTYMVY